MRQYKTSTGVYNEDELAIVVWMNPKQKNSKQSRLLETMTSEQSRFPMAFPLKKLTTNRSWKSAVVVSSSEDVFRLLQNSERSRPLLIPLVIAKSALGWNDFYVPTEYLDAEIK